MKIYPEPSAGFGTRLYELTDRAESGHEWLAVQVDDPLECMLGTEAICNVRGRANFRLRPPAGIAFYQLGNAVGGVDFYRFDDVIVERRYDHCYMMYEVDGQMRIFDQEGNENE